MYINVNVWIDNLKPINQISPQTDTKEGFMSSNNYYNFFFLRNREVWVSRNDAYLKDKRKLWSATACGQEVWQSLSGTWRLGSTWTIMQQVWIHVKGPQILLRTQERLCCLPVSSVNFTSTNNNFNLTPTIKQIRFTRFLI